MIKKHLYIILLLCSFSLFGQEEKVWEAEKDLLDYRKQEKYKGPDDWYGISPSGFDQEDEVVATKQNSSTQPLKYNPQQLKQDRSQRKNTYGNGGGNSVQLDPRVERPDPIELPDIDPPDIDGPDIDFPDWDWDWNFSSWEGVLKFLLLLLVLGGVFFLAYFIIKNRKPSNPSVVVDVEDKWNPEIVTKSALEIRLDEAMQQEDFRECIRIYFTFILKELIKKSWIHWKKDKTNHHYVMEMAKQSNAMEFNECVRIYDIVWYGDYNIDKEIYELLVPTLASYHKKIEAQND